MFRKTGVFFYRLAGVRKPTTILGVLRYNLHTLTS